MRQGQARFGSYAAAGRVMSKRQIILNAVFLLLVGAFLARLPQTIAYFRGETSWVVPIERVHNRLVRAYLEPIDADRDRLLQEAAIDGMLRALGDPYAQFIPASAAAAFDESLTGEFVGVGAEVRIEGGWLTIITPMPDSPALKAGLRPGDRVVAIDGRTTEGEAIEASVDRIKGEKGTTVVVTIERQAAESPEGITPALQAEWQRLDVPIVRQPLVASSVRGVRRLADSGRWDFLLDAQRGIVMVRVTQFTPGSAGEVRRAIESAAASLPAGVRGVVLDLRDNPGGDMQAALDVADLFLAGGVVLRVADRRGVVEIYEAGAETAVPAQTPVVVLVSRASASASEIVAGSLKDRGRAIVIGQRTYGKGLVQTVERLSGVPGARLKYTTQRYELPSGSPLHRLDDSSSWGIDPTEGFYIQDDPADWLQRARARLQFEIINGQNNNNQNGNNINNPPRFEDPDWIRTSLFDPVLAAGLAAAQSLVDGEPITTPTDPQTQGARIAMGELAELERTRGVLTAELMKPATRFSTSAMSEELVRLDRRIAAMRIVASADIVDTDRADEPSEVAALWDAQIDVTGGRIEVYDADGKRVATLAVPASTTLESGLLQAGVTPMRGDASEPANVPDHAEATPSEGGR